MTSFKQEIEQLESDDKNQVLAKDNWYIVQWDNRYIAFSTSNDDTLGHGSAGVIYRAYKISKDGTLQDDTAWVAKVTQQSIDAENDIGRQFYTTSPSIELSDNVGYVTFMPNLGEHDLAQHSDLLPNGLVDQLTIITQILEQMSLIHKNQILHNDIKSENILLKRAPNDKLLPSLADFGESKQASISNITQGFVDEAIPNNPEYQPPEFKPDINKTSYFSTKGDIYSLSSVMLNVFDKSHNASSKHDRFEFELIHIDDLWNDSDFDFRQHLIEFLNRMKSKLPSARPNTDECLRFFQEALQYAQMQLQKQDNIDEATIESLYDNQAIKAQLIALSRGAWHKKTFYNNTLTAIKDLPFNQEPDVCDMITQYANTISASQIQAYFSLQSNNNFSNQTKLKDYLTNGALNDEQLQALAELANHEQLTEQRLDAIQNGHFTSKQIQTIPLICTVKPI